MITSCLNYKNKKFCQLILQIRMEMYLDFADVCRLWKMLINFFLIFSISSFSDYNGILLKFIKIPKKHIS